MRRRQRWTRGSLALWCGVCLAAVSASGQSLRVRPLDDLPSPEENLNSMKHRLDPMLLPELPRCPDMASEPTCGLVELGQMDGADWFWFFHERVGVAAFGELIEQRDDGLLQRVWGLSTMSAFPMTAKRLELDAGTFLHIPVRYQGSGALREDRLFHWRQDHWQEIDTRQWMDAIELPPCYGIWKGPRIDFEKLSFVSGVWIEGDGNCCPSGGEIRIRLAIEGERLTITHQEHDLSEATGKVSDPHRRLGESCRPEP